MFDIFAMQLVKGLLNAIDDGEQFSFGEDIVPFPLFVHAVSEGFPQVLIVHDNFESVGLVWDGVLA